METLIEVCSRHYMIFFCEGRNEEDALRWIIESNRLSLDHEFCNFEYLRKLRTKNKRKDILTRILRDDYGREPALIYLLERRLRCLVNLIRLLFIMYILFLSLKSYLLFI